jgi:L-ribulose-5-phosphate 4-epimerase
MSSDSKKLIDLSAQLHKQSLIFKDFGNVSLRKKDHIIIKASGRSMSNLQNSDLVKVQLYNGEYNSKIKPSSDTPTHLMIYNAFDEINGVVHFHSTYATAWAQTGQPIPCLGTTHADYWNGEISVTRELTDDEISGEYEKETGKVIIEKIQELNVDPLACPGILVSNHGPFTWGKTVEDAVKHAELLEYIARMAWVSLSINPDAEPISKALLKKHFSRKHGPEAYYGQKDS